MIAEAQACSDQLAFALRSVKNAIRGLTPQQLEFVPAGLANSAATLVLHMAATEVTIGELLSGRRAPEDLRKAVLLDRYTPAPGGRPIAAADPGESADALTEKLDRARAFLTEVLEGLTAADLERTLTIGDRPTSVPFFLKLLPFHMASHCGQIMIIKRFLRPES